MSTTEFSVVLYFFTHYGINTKNTGNTGGYKYHQTTAQPAWRVDVSSKRRMLRWFATYVF